MSDVLLYDCFEAQAVHCRKECACAFDVLRLILLICLETHLLTFVCSLSPVVRLRDSPVTMIQNRHMTYVCDMLSPCSPSCDWHAGLEPSANNPAHVLLHLCRLFTFRLCCISGNYVQLWGQCGCSADGTVCG